MPYPSWYILLLIASCFVDLYREVVRNAAEVVLGMTSVLQVVVLFYLISSG